MQSELEEITDKLDLISKKLDAIEIKIVKIVVGIEFISQYLERLAKKYNIKEETK